MQPCNSWTKTFRRLRSSWQWCRTQWKKKVVRLVLNGESNIVDEWIVGKEANDDNEIIQLHAVSCAESNVTLPSDCHARQIAENQEIIVNIKRQYDCMEAKREKDKVRCQQATRASLLHCLFWNDQHHLCTDLQITTQISGFVCGSAAAQWRCNWQFFERSEWCSAGTNPPHFLYSKRYGTKR